MHEYIGQEKILVQKGDFKGIYGYVRMVSSTGHLYLILDNGQKSSVLKEDVQFIHPNYFVAHIPSWLI